MNDIGIKGIQKLSQDMSIKGPDKSENIKGGSFADMLKDSVEKVNNLQLEADQASQDLMLGKDKNIHQVMIAVEKANLSFQLMMQVRNKIITAYEEIMRTQV
jgi:flagellar hook-basal body complex protein FliE